MHVQHVSYCLNNIFFLRVHISKRLYLFAGDDLRIILRDLNLSNVLEERADRHFVTVDALSVAQLRDELEERGLSKKGKKTKLVARLKEAVGQGQKVALILLKTSEIKYLLLH